MTTRPEPVVASAPSRGGGHGRVYAGQSAEERDAARRERLLAAILDIAGTKGYAALTVERLCTMANVSTRNFYKQYDGKEAAFADLYDELLGQSGQRVFDSLAASTGQTLQERIPAALMAFLEPMFEDLRVARITFVEVVGLSARIEATRLRNRERLIELIEAEGSAAVRAGEVADRDFRFVALALIGATTAIAHDWMIRSPRQPLERLERQLTELAVQLLTA